VGKCQLSVEACWLLTAEVLARLQAQALKQEQLPKRSLYSRVPVQWLDCFTR